MRAERFGSYSIDTTVAQTSSLRALEVDDAVHPLVAAATEARADDALVVAAALLGLAAAAATSPASSCGR